MRSHTRTSIFALAALMSATAGVFAATPADFTAAGSPGNPGDAVDGLGNPVNLWTLTTQSNDGGAGGYQAGSGDNYSWSIYSYGSPLAGTAQMDTTFAGGGLVVGQTVAINWSNRFIATGESVGVAVTSGGSPSVALSFVGGNSSGSYSYTDATQTNTSNGVGYIFETLNPFIVTVTSATTYLASWHGNQWAGTYSGPLDGFRVFNYSAGDYSDVFANNLHIGALPNTWTATAGGAWSGTGNWDTGSPNGAGSSAVFGASDAAQSVNVDGAYTVQTMVIDSPASYTFSGSGSLTLQGSVSSSNISVRQGSHTISVPLTLADASSSIDVEAGATLTAASISGTGTLTKTGQGTLHADNLNVGFLSVVGGTLQLHTDSLPRTGSASVVTASGLYVLNDGAPLGSRTYFSTIDVGTSDMIIFNGNVGEVQDMARSGQGGANGLFTGTGLTSSAAAADANGLLRYAVGVIQNDFEGTPIYTTFDGVPVSDSDVLVKFTYFGDADLNGEIDDTDFFLINNGYGLGLSGWINGDFDYSGTIDDTDFFLINNAFGLQGQGLRGGSVPEPTAMGLIALGAGAVLGRRRK